MAVEREDARVGQLVLIRAGLAEVNVMIRLAW